MIAAEKNTIIPSGHLKGNIFAKVAEKTSGIAERIDMEYWEVKEKELREARDEEKTKKYLCKDCGAEKYAYLGKIAGIIKSAKSCYKCGRFDGLFYYFDLRKKAYPWQKEYFATL